MTSLFSWRCAAFLVALVSAPSAFASSSTTYTYDALGRLRTVTVSGTQTSVQSYDYDAAGNRTLSTSGIVPSVPPSITVPSASITGSFTISWGVSTGTVTAYELYQANNASFSGQTKVYSGTATSSALSGRANGTYYYRVRACSTIAACSGYRTGGNAITVTLPPSVPPSIEQIHDAGMNVEAIELIDLCIDQQRHRHSDRAQGTQRNHDPCRHAQHDRIARTS